MQSKVSDFEMVFTDSDGCGSEGPFSDLIEMIVFSDMTAMRFCGVPILIFDGWFTTTEPP